MGKGVVFDAGGLNLKPPSAMTGMHGDKSGAAVVGAIFGNMAGKMAAAGIRLVALMPMVENTISGSAMRPGDIVKACNGLTVEIGDTDAEGRLILADALAYAGKEYPGASCMIDFATMTGYGTTIHHDLAAVFYTLDDALSKRVIEAGDAMGERVWRMPPWSEYAYLTGSKVADVRSYGWGTQDDGFMASLFLGRFIHASCKSWMHVDISKNTLSGDESDTPFIATGVALGVELLTTLT